MRASKILCLTMIFVLLSSPYFSIISAEEEVTIENLVTANFDISLKSGTDLYLEIEMDVKKITLQGAKKTTYTSDQISDIAETDLIKLGTIIQQINIDLSKQIKNIFPDTIIDSPYESPYYEDGVFKNEYAINLTNSFFGLNQSVNANDFINGILDMSGRVNYTFDLQAETGWNNTYIIDLGEEIDYHITNGKVSNKFIEWKVLNGGGQQPNKMATVTLLHSNPTSKPNSEDIYLYFTLDSRTGETSLKSSIYVDTLDIKNYNVLPDFVTNLNYLNSDGVRLFVDNKFLDWNETIYEKTLKPIQSKIKENIESSSLNQTLNLVFSWDKESTTNCQTPFNIENMNDDPSIIGNLVDDSIGLKIADITEKAMYGLLNTGGVANISKEDINFGEKLKDINLPYNITILFPKNISIDKQNPFTWNDTLSFKGFLRSKNDPDYNNEEISRTIEIDFKNSDLNLLGFFTNNPEMNFDLEINQNKKSSVIKKPDEFSIPEEILLSFLNSDAIRLCIQENVFSNKEVDDYLDNQKDVFEEDISEIITNLDVTGKINRDSFNKNINQNVNISNMGKKTPVETQISANIIYPTKFSFSFLPPRFIIPEQNYIFTGVKNQSVTYKMVFPNGIDIDVDDTLDKIVKTQNKNRQTILEISFSPEEYNLSSVASVKMNPTPLFLIGLFMPCIISFIIVLILVIVIFIIRKKRKFKKPSGFFKDNEPREDSSYDEQDYYVPPPPGSK